MGTWIVEADTLIQGDSTLGSGDAIITPAASYETVRVETRAHVLDLTPGLGRAYVAVWTAFAPGAQVAGIQNAVENQDGATNADVRMIQFFGDGQSGAIGDTQFATSDFIETGDTITLVTDYRFPSTISSTMYRERGGLTLHMDRSLAEVVSGNIGLGTHAASAAFDYVLVTTAVPSLPCPAR
ncbi:MAG TPA: hypothetical protein VFQ53_14275 [Kofleriaceae bacterium]|nr:hypothetical protein [Kofleriaceae bacterium]